MQQVIAFEKVQGIKVPKCDQCCDDGSNKAFMRRAGLDFALTKAGLN